jgi:hypothetical protein
MPVADVFGAFVCVTSKGANLFNYSRRHTRVTRRAVEGNAYVVDQHSGTFPREQKCMFPAESATSPRNHSHASVERTFHQITPQILT